MKRKNRTLRKGRKIGEKAKKDVERNEAKENKNKNKNETSWGEEERDANEKKNKIICSVIDAFVDLYSRLSYEFQSQSIHPLKKLIYLLVESQ